MAYLVRWEGVDTAVFVGRSYPLIVPLLPVFASLSMVAFALVLAMPGFLAILAIVALVAIPAVMWSTSAQARFELTAKQVRVEGWFGLLPRRMRISVPISDLDRFRPTTGATPDDPDSPAEWQVEIGFSGRTVVLHNLRATTREIVAVTDAIAERAKHATGSALDIPAELRELADHTTPHGR